MNWEHELNVIHINLNTRLRRPRRDVIRQTAINFPIFPIGRRQNQPVGFHWSGINNAAGRVKKLVDPDPRFFSSHFLSHRKCRGAQRQGSPLSIQSDCGRQPWSAHSATIDYRILEWRVAHNSISVGYDHRPLTKALVKRSAPPSHVTSVHSIRHRRPNDMTHNELPIASVFG